MKKIWQIRKKKKKNKGRENKGEIKGQEGKAKKASALTMIRLEQVTAIYTLFSQGKT